VESFDIGETYVFLVVWGYYFAVVCSHFEGVKDCAFTVVACISVCPTRKCLVCCVYNL